MRLPYNKGLSHRVDLEKAEAEIAAAHGSHRGGNLHGAGGLSRGVICGVNDARAQQSQLARSVHP